MENIINFAKSPLFIVVVILLGIAGLIVWNIISKSRKSKTRSFQHSIEADNKPVQVSDDVVCADGEVLKTDGSPNVMILDMKRRRRYLRFMEKIQTSKDYGRQWLYGTNWVFLLCLNAENVLAPVMPPVDMNHSPEELYEALDTRDDTLEVLGPQKEENNTVKIGWIILIAGCALFLMFAAYMKKGG